MEIVAARAAYERLHEEMPFHDGTFTRWGKTRSASFPYGHSDGVEVGVADEDLAPWDEFTTKVAASPIAHEGEPGQGQVREGE